MPEFDLVVKNGMIVDGTSSPRFRDDIGIKHGRIAKIGRIMPNEATRVIEADGLIVAPGSSTCTPTTTLRFSGTPT